MDASDNQLKSTFSAFGRTTEVRSKMMKAVPGLVTGVCFVQIVMAQPVPNFLGIGLYVV